MKNCVITAFLFLFTLNASSVVFQKDTVFNQTDSKGMKQGWWKKSYPNGKLMYKGYFKNDKPVGELIRYHESGVVKAIMDYDTKGEYARTKIFYEDGTIASEGNYYLSKKDSVWNYYSYYDKKIRSKETYEKGMKTGFSYQYYPSGVISEKIGWKNGEKEGAWEQYFEDGTLRLKASYSDDKLSGDFVVYQGKNFPLTQGKFVNDVREGLWLFFDENGRLDMKINYTNGKPDNEEALTQKQIDYFKKIDQNIGRFTEPNPYDLMPGGRQREYEY